MFPGKWYSTHRQ